MPQIRPFLLPTHPVPDFGRLRVALHEPPRHVAVPEEDRLVQQTVALDDDDDDKKCCRNYWMTMENLVMEQIPKNDPNPDESDSCAFNHYADSGSEYRQEGNSLGGQRHPSI